jgi:hypothetical protein
MSESKRSKKRINGTIGPYESIKATSKLLHWARAHTPRGNIIDPSERKCGSHR